MANVVAPVSTLDTREHSLAVDVDHVDATNMKMGNGKNNNIEHLTDHNFVAAYVVDEAAIVPKFIDGSTQLVVLFGWAGCRDRYLSKYASFYEEAGMSTVRFTAPISKVRSFASYRAFALEVYEKVFESELNYDVYFHVFSMNGCSVFAALWDLFDTMPNEKALKHRVKGILFDSCPANVSPQQSARAISFATMPPSSYHPAVRESYKAILLTYLSVHRAMIWLRSMFEDNVYEKNFAFFRLLAMNDLPQRQIYLYGPADDICSDFSIEQFAGAQKNLGKEVHLINLPDSAHCQHLRVHAERYKDSCIHFVNDEEMPPSAA